MDLGEGVRFRSDRASCEGLDMRFSPSPENGLSCLLAPLALGLSHLSGVHTPAPRIKPELASADKTAPYQNRRQGGFWFALGCPLSHVRTTDLVTPW